MSAPPIGTDWVIYEIKERTPSAEDMVVFRQGRRYSAGDVPMVEQVREINEYVEQMNFRQNLKIRTVLNPEEVKKIEDDDKKMKEEEKKVRKFSCTIL